MEADGGPWPSNKKAAFAIRDDDVSYFTHPWMLDKLYAKAWRLGFKVSLAVIPEIKATQSLNVPASFRGSNKAYPISKNKDLLAYLREKMEGGYVDIIQHGYSHASEGEKPEFAANNFRLLDEKLKKGNKLLNQAFRRDVRVFVAPHERVSRAAWKSISKNKMCLSRRFTLGRYLVTTPFFSIKIPRLVKTIMRSPNPFKPIKSSVIDLSDTLVIQWDLLMSQTTDLEDRLEYARKVFFQRLGSGEPFVILHHHWEYFYGWESKKVNRDLLAHFNSFLNFVSSKNEIWKTTLSDMCSSLNTT